MIFVSFTQLHNTLVLRRRNGETKNSLLRRPTSWRGPELESLQEVAEDEEQLGSRQRLAETLAFPDGKRQEFVDSTQFAVLAEEPLRAERLRIREHALVVHQYRDLRYHQRLRGEFKAIYGDVLTHSAQQIDRQDVGYSLNLLQ